MKNLVIVESPSKSKTIQKYLGPDYTVVSSKGHIRDLAIRGKDGLGVDVEAGFVPTYEISKDKKEIVKDLQNKAAKAGQVFLATDPDREGEAISWHLAQELGLSEDAVDRVTFHEITHNAVRDASLIIDAINLKLIYNLKDVVVNILKVNQLDKDVLLAPVLTVEDEAIRNQLIYRFVSLINRAGDIAQGQHNAINLARRNAVLGVAVVEILLQIINE